jgi:hypothetical protein
MMCFSVAGQTVLLNVDQNNEIPETKFGPNLKKFTHFYLRGGFLASADEPGAEIIYGSSVNLSFGLRKKYKISPVYSLGFEIEYEYTDYKMKQETGKIFPDTVINNISQRLDYSTFALGFFNRFNFDPSRGNFMGTYLDIGILGEYHYSINTISKNDLPDGTRQKVVTGDLDYTNTMNAKIIARLGYSHIALYGSYRLADLFDFEDPLIMIAPNTPTGYPDLPRVIVGIELSLY